MPAVHLIIKGKVQGVFFRATAKDVADEMNIKGWVRNTSEGDVEIFANGLKEDIERYIQWCRRGPSKAVVTNVIVTPKEEKSSEQFKILH